jgi:hypothetical protein
MITNKKECLNNDCQQVHEYQQQKKNVKAMIVNNSSNINKQKRMFVDIGGIVDNHCLNILFWLTIIV